MSAAKIRRMTPKIKKLLIANRAEIALRIHRSCKALGIKTVCIYSDADSVNRFISLCDEAVRVGESPAKDSYLAIEKIIKAAKDTGCDAVHPGYGFLSENGDFAEQVRAAGLTFVGPTTEAIRAFGSKTEARARVKKYNVPCTPGSEGGLSDDELSRAGVKIGFPVLIKAVGGGGGRGMRVVRSREEMKESVTRARAEALKNFANDDVYLEKFIENPRHVEVQIFGDSQGNIVHLGTRDCTTQRRHQKLIEEAPAPFLSPTVRKKLHDAAVKAGKAVGYQSAGTVEFLVKGEDIYFLEVNTRIQVEHPVTEEVTGIDLVDLQLRVAQGEPLPFTQKDVRFKGHAIEFRIYAEDPSTGFLPSIGPLTRIEKIDSPHIREEEGLFEGDVISPFYDAMFSKIIARGSTRLEAAQRAYEYFKTYKVTGVATNVTFHRWMLSRPEFKDLSFDIGFIERAFNAQSLRELQAQECRDPMHREPTDGALFIEQVVLEKDRNRSIKIIHERGGTFLGVPCLRGKEASNKKLFRRSNSRKALIEAMEL